MAVKFKINTRTHHVNGVLNTNPGLVDDMIVASIISSIESYLDSIVDGDNVPSSVTPSKVLEILNQEAIKETALSYVRDMLFDLQLAIENRMSEVNCPVQVNSLHYHDDGKLAGVDVTPKFTTTPGG